MYMTFPTRKSLAKRRCPTELWVFVTSMHAVCRCCPACCFNQLESRPWDSNISANLNPKGPSYNNRVLGWFLYVLYYDRLSSLGGVDDKYILWTLREGSIHHCRTCACAAKPPVKSIYWGGTPSSWKPYMAFRPMG